MCIRDSPKPMIWAIIVKSDQIRKNWWPISCDENLEVGKKFFAASSVKKISRFAEVSPEEIERIAWKFAKTVILLGLAGYELIISNEAVGRVGYIYISSYPARPRRIIVKYPLDKPIKNQQNVRSRCIMYGDPFCTTTHRRTKKETLRLDKNQEPIEFDLSNCYLTSQNGGGWSSWRLWYYRPWNGYMFHCYFIQGCNCAKESSELYGETWV